jgi:hypothetical protein
MTKQDAMVNPEDVTPDRLEYGETQPPRVDVKEQRGGPQDNQISGQTEKGARNDEAKEKNPQRSEPDRWSR